MFFLIVSEENKMEMEPVDDKPAPVTIISGLNDDQITNIIRYALNPLYTTDNLIEQYDIKYIISCTSLLQFKKKDISLQITSFIDQHSC